VSRRVLCVCVCVCLCVFLCASQPTSHFTSTATIDKNVSWYASVRSFRFVALPLSSPSATASLTATIRARATELLGLQCLFGCACVHSCRNCCDLGTFLPTLIYPAHHYCVRVCVCVCVRARAHDRYQMCNNDDSTHRECINWSDDNKVSALARSMHQWVPYVAGCASIASCAFQ
jgi:hypothetical protein